MSNMLKSINPSSGELIGEVKITSQNEINEKVENARTAFNTWKLVPVNERVEIITRAFEALAPMQRDLAKLMSMEMGKSGGRSMGEVSSVIHNAE
jgi:acyl-CoA reductase-like NAD-dependent aldehyde dehydrogenase